MTHNEIMTTVLEWADYKGYECIGIGACHWVEGVDKPRCAAAFRRNNQLPFVVWHISVAPDGEVYPFWGHYLDTPEAAMDCLAEKAFRPCKSSLLCKEVPSSGGE